MNLRLRFLICLAGALGAGVPSRADTVQTVGARLKGEMALVGSQIRIGGEAVPLGDVVSAIRETRGSTISAPHVIRLKNGEVWCGWILGLESEKLIVTGDLFGQCAVGTDDLSSLDFVPRLDSGVSLKRGTLYREEGEPIPGTLLWIRKQLLAVDCPLGVLTVPQKGTFRYLFRDSPGASSTDADEEIGLIDGSIFRGRVSLVDNGVELKHAVLGALPVPLAAVRYILRSPPAVMRLGLPAPGDIELRGFAGLPAEPRLMDYRRDPPDPAGPSCLAAVRIRSGTTARYRLRGRARRKAEFHAAVAPVPGCRGDVRIGLRVAGGRVYEQSLAATNEPVQVLLELPAGDELAIEVDFDGRLLYPCGVDWQDPYVVFRDDGSGE